MILSALFGRTMGYFQFWTFGEGLLSQAALPLCSLGKKRCVFCESEKAILSLENFEYFSLSQTKPVVSWSIRFTGKSKHTIFNIFRSFLSLCHVWRRGEDLYKCTCNDHYAKRESPFHSTASHVAPIGFDLAPRYSLLRRVSSFLAVRMNIFKPVIYSQFSSLSQPFLADQFLEYI